MFATEILMALVVLLVCLAWYPCCCDEDEAECLYCTAGTTPSSVSVTLSDWVADDCSDMWMNTTFTLAPIAGVDCQFAWTGSFMCGGSSYYCSVQIAYQPIPGTGTIGVRVIVTMIGTYTQTVEYQWDSDAEDAIDCSASRELTLASDTGADLYDPSASTCEVN